MHPALLFPLALLTPILLAAALFAPAYASIYVASYIVYDGGGGPHPLAGKWVDVFYIIDVYHQLFTHWIGNMKSLGVIDYAAPVIGLPALGIMFSVWLTWKIGAAMVNVFRLSSSH